MISMIFCYKALEPKLDYFENLLKTNKSSKSLKNLAESKHAMVKKCYAFTVFGLLIIFIFLILSLSENVWPEYAWENKGFSLYKEGKYDEALKAFNKSIELNPNYAYVWYEKADTFIKQGKYDAAVKALNEAISINPNYYYAWNNKGIALLNQGKYYEALNSFNESARINPNYRSALWNRGVALEKLERHSEAKAAFADANS
jgi:tetratricopeptide (TPR) repeat protein